MQKSSYEHSKNSSYNSKRTGSSNKTVKFVCFKISFKKESKPIPKSASFLVWPLFDYIYRCACVCVYLYVCECASLFIRISSVFFAVLLLLFVLDDFLMIMMIIVAKLDHRNKNQKVQRTKQKKLN